MIALLLPLKKEYRVFYFFPFFHTGGAEKIHLQVAQATGGADCIIYFTRKSADNRFLDEFQHTGCDIRNISSFTDNKWLYFLNLIFRGIVTGYINKQKKLPVVFNGQSNFGYKISPWIKSKIPQIELIHSLNSFSVIRIPFLPFITQTVMISKKRIADHQHLYAEMKIPEYYDKKIIYIPNAASDTTVHNPTKEQNIFRVLYVGRGGKEKRIHLVAKMAEKIHQADNSIQFEFLGNVSGVIDIDQYPYAVFYGNISDEKTISAIYEKAHVLVLTSSTEGFPLVVIEAMQHGCAILATPVGDIPVHIQHDKNGFLFSSVDDEEIIIKEGVNYILQLKQNRNLYEEISNANFHYAKHNFTMKNFMMAYRQLFESVIGK